MNMVTPMLDTAHAQVPILVTGGTGLLGSHVLPRLQTAGRAVRVLSRTPHVDADGTTYMVGDLASDTGLDAALAGVHTVLHLAGGPKGDAEATANLVRAAARAGVQQLVYISVIGAERVPLGWFQSKAGAEQVIMASGIPWTILRAAQFHDLVFKVVQKMGALPVVPTPGGLRFQPVDVDEVAARLVQLTLAAPAGLVPDMPGPTVYGMREMISAYLAARGKRRAFLPLRMPGKAGRAYRAGENLALHGAQPGTRTWDAFLAERVVG